MTVSPPHYLLYAAADHAAEDAHSTAGRWQFVLRTPDGATALEAADDEPHAGAERLELLAIVRGLEALDQPSRVTLIAGSRQIQRGLKFGLAHWRENGWQWERYGQMTPVKNGDLWQRLDRLVEIHAVECRASRQEIADDLSHSKAVAAEALPSVRRKHRGRLLRIDRPRAAASASGNRNVGILNKPGFRLVFGLCRFAGRGSFRLATWARRFFSESSQEVSPRAKHRAGRAVRRHGACKNATTD